MILRALYQLARDKDLVKDLDYQEEPIRFVLSVGPHGQNARILDRMEVVSSMDASKRSQLHVPRMKIPRQEKLTSGDTPHFLVNGSEYIFGADLAGQRDPAKLEQRIANYRRQVEEILAATKSDSEADSAFQAVLAFLSLPPEQRRAPLDILINATGDGPERTAVTKALAHGKFAIQFEPLAPACVHDLSAVRSYWQSLRQGDDSGPSTTCLVTGASGRAARQHPRVKGVPGGSPGDAALVSFNKSAFWSYGHEYNDNAPVGRDVAEACGNALNWLLQKRHRCRVDISKDAAALFWAKQSLEFLYVLGDDPDSVRAMLTTPYRGTRPALEEPDDFFTLVISGFKARSTVRSFFSTTTSRVHDNVLKYLDDLEIERPERRGARGVYPMYHLVESLGRKGGKTTEVEASLAASIYMAALTGGEFPLSLLLASLLRNRAEAAWNPDEKREHDKWSRFAARCSLIRACLIRNRTLKELTVSLDPDNQQPGYLLGRLLALIDRIQYEASDRKINATIADRYYGAASSRPGIVFPTLLRLNSHHMGKLRREKPFLAIVYDRVLQEVTGGLRSFPRMLTLEAQGLFALGFHHQRQAFFLKTKSDNSAD